MLNLIQSHLVFYKTPTNINFLWNFGFILMVLMVVQIVTGIILTTQYTPDILLSWDSLICLSRNVYYGYLFRYIHGSLASLIFICLYIHMYRSLIYQSYVYNDYAWLVGMVLFILVVVIAFLGYVLPLGQMSYWGAIVIINIFSFIPWLVTLVYGSYVLSNYTLKRLYILHFILPFVMLVIICIHIFYLHFISSNNPLLIAGHPIYMNFMPWIIIMDLKSLTFIIILFMGQIFFYLKETFNPDNSIPASSTITPLSITPEWYFLAFYAILKSIPNKLGGTLILVGVFLVLFLLVEVKMKWAILYISNMTSEVLSLICPYYILVWIGAQLPLISILSYGVISAVWYFVGLYGMVYKGTLQGFTCYAYVYENFRNKGILIKRTGIIPKDIRIGNTMRFVIKNYKKDFPTDPNSETLPSIRLTKELEILLARYDGNVFLYKNGDEYKIIMLHPDGSDNPIEILSGINPTPMPARGTALPAETWDFVAENYVSDEVIDALPLEFTAKILEDIYPMIKTMLTPWWEAWGYF